MRKSAPRLLVVILLFFLATNLLHSQTCKTGKLDPGVAGMLKMIPADNRSLEELKSSTDISQERKTAGPPPIPFPKDDAQRIKITSDSIPITILNPSHKSGLPIIINYHPGGFILPLTAGCEFLAWKDARDFNAIVFAVDYRVAPENKFPAAVNDSYKALKWIIEHGQQYGGDTSRIIVMGVSAGANIAAVICQKAVQDKIAHRIKLQIMNSPVVDNPSSAASYPSMDENANGYMLTKAAVLFAQETYADKSHHNNPEFAPIISKKLSGLPPAVIITAEFDPLRDQGIAYANLLSKAGIKVWQQCYPGEIHCLIGTPPDGANAKAMQQLILDAMAVTFNSR